MLLSTLVDQVTPINKTYYKKIGKTQDRVLPVWGYSFFIFEVKFIFIFVLIFS